MRMTKADFLSALSRIEFRFVQPMDPLPQVGFAYSDYFGRKLPFHYFNTLIRDMDADTRAMLDVVAPVDAMSTMANAFLINEITKYLEPDECYLNVGVWKGFSFLSGCCNSAARSVGVDNFSEFGGPKAEFLQSYQKVSHDKSQFHEMDYRNYFETKHEGSVGFYFYDGEHSYENQLKGLEVAEPYLSPGAMLLVDDTNLDAARRATIDFMMARHGQYEIWFDQLTVSNLHPTYHNGLMILKKVA